MSRIVSAEREYVARRKTKALVLHLLMLLGKIGLDDIAAKLLP